MKLQYTVKFGLAIKSHCCVYFFNLNGSHLDPDVLDTWFSSALLPFTALGWPDQVWFSSIYFFIALMNYDKKVLLPILIPAYLSDQNKMICLILYRVDAVTRFFVVTITFYRYSHSKRIGPISLQSLKNAIG